MRSDLKSLTGLGYRAPFHSEVLHGHPEIGWVEVITENYLWNTGARRQTLERLRSHYELAFHGVTLSLASPEEHDLKYLRELRAFCDTWRPVRVSDHLCWSSMKGHHWNDLLPFPYTEENLQRLTAKVSRWQDLLARPLVVENLSTYLACRGSEMTEYAFINELCQRTGCQILLDLNNMVVNARNFGVDPRHELSKIDLRHVAQIHLAGFSEAKHFVVDTHNRAPVAETWELLRHVHQRRGDIPFMLEWDSEFPGFEVIWGILQEARSIYQGHA